jgi:hypothetical protein
MIALAMHTTGSMAGAARPITCAALSYGIDPAAPVHGHTWLAAQVKPVSSVFITDRPIPRPPDLSP